MPYKLSADRGWVWDWAGVSEEVARLHGYRGGARREPSPAERRQLDRDITAAAAEFARQHQWRLARMAAEAAAKLAEKAKRQAAARERARVRQRLYFAKWYSLNRGKVAARRKAQREAASPIT